MYGGGFTTELLSFSGRGSPASSKSVSALKPSPKMGISLDFIRDLGDNKHTEMHGNADPKARHWDPKNCILGRREAGDSHQYSGVTALPAQVVG